jgi:protein-S-isoprenylcysteine O-methyltransferase Ste14
MDSEATFRTALALVMIVTMSVTVYHRLQAGRSGEKISHREEGYLFAAALRLAGVGFWIGLVLFLFFPHAALWTRISLPDEIRWCGVAIGAVTPALMYWTLHHLGKNLTDTVVTRSAATLVTSGPYRWVRHPFYVTAASLLTAATLVSASWILAITSVVILVMLAIRTPNEERRLVARFGADYRTYMVRTGRFFPRIGS